MAYKYIIVCTAICLLFARSIAVAQKTYAIIAGISGYQSEEIPALNYSHRDAQAFADYLSSASGGSVPAEQVKLFLNEQATVANIYEAMYDLLLAATKGDRVLFYFSGHGDVEQQFASGLGFLLAWNSPPNNYLNNAIRLEDVNHFAQTLSTKNEAEVIIIADACRSGKLAGDKINGRRLLGANLRKSALGELRLASCGPDELAVENRAWGGGRGVFSYYLLKGLQEESASLVNATGITGKSLYQYISNSLENDPLLLQKKHVQKPLIDGNGDMVIARPTINKRIPKSADMHGAPLPVEVAPAQKPFSISLTPLRQRPEDGVALKLKQTRIAHLLDFEQLEKANDAELIGQVLDVLLPMASKNDSLQINEVKKSLSNNPVLPQRITSAIAVNLSNEGQQMINAYLRGDIAELEKRKYYEAKNQKFDQYVAMYRVALRYCISNSYLQHLLKVQQLYFEGVAERMNTYREKNNIKHLNAALSLQQKALKLEPFAPYIHNELGNLYLWINKPDSAYYHFMQATELAPSWYLPWSNLTGFYNIQKKYNEARKAAAEARKLKPATIKNFFANEAVTDEMEGNYLRAEASHVLSIDANPLHYFPYERLGFIYTRTARYHLADSMLYEADLRKKGYYFPGPPDTDLDGIPSIMEVDPPIPSPPECIEFKLPDPGKDPDLFLVHAMYKLNGDNLSNKPDTAQVLNMLWKGLQFAPLHPLLNYQIARLLKLQQYPLEALPYIQQSYKGMGQKFMPIDTLTMLTQKWEKYKIENCLIDIWRKALIERTEVGYQLIMLYEHLGYIHDAVAVAKSFTYANDYEEVILGWQQMARLNEKNSHKESAWYCWQMYKQIVHKKSKQLEDGFKLWYYDEERMLGVVDDFLIRQVQANPLDTLWLIRAGNHLYELVASNPMEFIFSDSAFENLSEGLPNHRSFSKFKPIRNLYNFATKNLLWKPRSPFPYKNALNYLKMANERMVGPENLYTTYGQIADLYSWANNSEEAIENLHAQLQIKPADAQVQARIANELNLLKRNYESFLLLDTLFNAHRLKPAHWPTYGLWAAYANYKSSWQNLLQTASPFYYITNDSLYYVQGIGYMLTEPAKAIPFFKNKMTKWMSEGELKYSLATLYAKEGNKKLALQNLKLALKAGFNYGYVLKNDLTWSSYRRQNSWKKIVTGYSFKEYGAGQRQD